MIAGASAGEMSGLVKRAVRVGTKTPAKELVGLFTNDGWPTGQVNEIVAPREAISADRISHIF